MTSEVEEVEQPDCDEVQAKVEEIKKLEADIKKELGLLQLRMKLESNEKRKTKATRPRALSLGFREHFTLFIVVFALLFAVSPVFRGLVVAAYKHYLLGLDLNAALAKLT